MKNIFKSLSGFQNDCPVLHKGTKGYGYTYTELSDIITTINPILAKHGLSYTQMIEGTSLLTIICHFESGESIESRADIPQDVQLKGMNDFQVMGAAITYFRRYCLSSALGIVTDKDVDAASPVEQKKEASSIVNKASLPDDRFKKAMASINKGEYTIKELRANFRLTNDQEKQVSLVEKVEA